MSSTLKSTKRAVLVLLLQASSWKPFVLGLVEPTADAKIGSVAEFEHVDPSLAAVNNGPKLLPFDTLPALLNKPDLDLPRNENPFGPSGTSNHHGLGLGRGNERKISVDARSGRPSSIDLAKPIIPGKGVGNSLLWSVDAQGGDDGSHGGPPKSHKEIEKISHSAIENWFHSNEGLLEIDSKHELFQQGRTRMAVHGPAGEMIQLSAQRTFQGLEVKGSRATATVNNGNLINVGLEQWGDIPADFHVEPTITADEAVAAVADLAGREVVEGKENCKSELLILPLVSSESSFVRDNLFNQLRGGGQGNNAQGGPNGDESYDHKLVWKVCPVLEGQVHEIMEAYVDAHTAHIYSFKDTVDYLNNARGSVYPLSNDGVGQDGTIQLDWPMPWMDVGSTTTTTGGNYEGAGSMTGRFYGPYVNMADQCGTDSLTQSGGLNWGNSGGTDCTTPGIGGAGNTHSSRSGFYEINKMKEIARSRLPNNSWLTQRLTANMNINSNCNAFWNGSTINFYTSGGGCANTGEIAAIFDHEWGHGMDANDVNGGIASPSGEGIADLYAALRLGDPCIGRGFQASTCTNGGQCKTCTGVRTIDYMGRTRERPFTLTDVKSTCGSNNVHCIGIAYAEAVWDLYKRWLKAAPYNYDDNTALEIVTRLTYIAAGNIGTWFSNDQNSTPQNSGCGSNSGYNAFVAADDDNGNVNDGTPHMTAIWNAFNSHEIACASGPIVQDSGCSGMPTSTPTVTVTPSNGENIITWTGVAGASAYEVLRTEGVHECTQGKVLLATVASSQTFSWTDSGLQNDREYYYIVVPKGSADSCYGRSSACKRATPVDGPSMSVSCPYEPVMFDPDVVPAQDTRQCTVVGSNGWSGTVQLGCSASGSFSGITCGVSESSVSINNNSAEFTLNINAGSSASVGEGTVQLTANGGAIVKTFSVDVKVSKIPQMAVYDASTKSPKCAAFGASCDSGSLLVGRRTLGPEPNYPNTINGASCDGGSGSYHADESLDRLVVRSLDGDDMYEESTIEIVATVWAWSTGSSDSLDLYYTNNPSNLNWQYLTTIKPPGGGPQELTTQVQLLPGLNHAVRGNFRYNGSTSSCSGGSYDDADDLVFTVKERSTETESPTAIPSAAPSASRVPSAKPTVSISPSKSQNPSRSPSKGPSGAPSFSPSKTPTFLPSSSPSKAPVRSCLGDRSTCRDNSDCCSNNCRFRRGKGSCRGG